MTGCEKCGETVVHALGLCRKCLDKKRIADREAKIAAGNVPEPVRPAHINIGLKICSVCGIRAASIRGMCSICGKRVKKDNMTPEELEIVRAKRRAYRKKKSLTDSLK